MESHSDGKSENLYNQRNYHSNIDHNQQHQLNQNYNPSTMQNIAQQNRLNSSLPRNLHTTTNIPIRNGHALHYSQGNISCFSFVWPTNSNDFFFCSVLIPVIETIQNLWQIRVQPMNIDRQRILHSVRSGNDASWTWRNTLTEKQQTGISKCKHVFSLGFSNTYFFSYVLGIYI